MDYQQISCSLFDRLESLAVTKKNIEVSYKNENDEEISIEGFIQNIFSENKAEFLQIRDVTIRLDKITTIKEL